MPYSVPRRRTRRSSHQQVESSSDGGQDQRYPAEEEGLASPSSSSSSSSRLLHPLPINVLSSQQPSASTPRRKQRTATPSQTPATLSRSPGGVSSAPMELPTPPDSFSEQGSVSRLRKRKNNNDNNRFENTPTPSRTPPPPAKRTRGSVSAQREAPSSTSKGRQQHEQHNNTNMPDRSMRARSNRIDQSMSTLTRKMSPQTELSLLQDQSAPTGFYDELSEDDEDEVYMRDRCIYLPTRRTRDLSRSRNLSNMTMSPRVGLMGKGIASTALSGEEGEDLQKTIIEERREEEQEQEQEQEAEAEAWQDLDQPWSPQDAASLPIRNGGDYDGVQDMPSSDEGGDAVVKEVQDGSDQDKAVKERRDGSEGRMEQSPRYSSPLPSPFHSEAAGSFDALFSPNARRDLPAAMSIPMESTPFALGKRPVQGRRSTPHHPNQERKVRESLAALNSPHKAQRVPGEKRIIDLAEIRLSSSPLGYSSPNLQSRSTLESLQSLSLESSRRSKERERELSTVLAQEASDDDSSDEDDHLSHFTIVANTTAKMMTPAKGRPEAGEAEEDEEESTMSIPREPQHNSIHSRLREESEEILADDFVYETVIVDDVDRHSSPARGISGQAREERGELVHDAEDPIRGSESPQTMLGGERRQQNEESVQEEEMEEDDPEEEEMEVEEAEEEEEQEEMGEEDEASLAVEEENAVEEMEEEGEEEEEGDVEEGKEEGEDEEQEEQESEEEEEMEEKGSDREEAVELRPSTSSVETHEAEALSHKSVRSPPKETHGEAPGGTSLARRIEVTQDSSSDEEDSLEEAEQDEIEEGIQDEELDEEQEEISPARGSYDDEEYPQSEPEDGIASEDEDDDDAEEEDELQSPNDSEEEDEEGHDGQSDSERGEAVIEAAMNDLDEEELRYRALEEVSEPSLMRAGDVSRSYSRETVHFDDEEKEGEEGQQEEESVEEEEEEEVEEEEEEAPMEEHIALGVEYEESEQDVSIEEEDEEEERDGLQEFGEEDESISEEQGGDEDVIDRMDGEGAFLSRSSPKSVGHSRQEALSDTGLPFMYDDRSRTELAPIKETINEPRLTLSVHEASPVVRSTSRTWGATDDSSRRRNVVESSRVSINPMQSQPSSPLVMEVRYNPAEDMSINEEEVARRQRQQATSISRSKQQQQQQQQRSSDRPDEHSRFGRQGETSRQQVINTTPRSVALSATRHADGSKSTIQSRIVNDTVMTDEANTTVADYMRDRVERLAATPTTIEITSLNPEVAAKCVAILQEHHRYLQCGRLDAEVEEDQGSLSVYPVQDSHSVRKDLRPLVDDRPGPSPRQQRPTRDYSPIEAEPRSVAKRSILIDDKPTTSTSGSPRTPSLPGAFPGARMANGTPSRAGSRAGDTRDEYSPLPPNRNAEMFSKQDWRLLDKVAEEHVRARARQLQQSSQMGKGEALLQAAASLNRTPIADAFFAVRRGIEAGHSTASWDEQAIDIKIRAVIRKFLRGLQRKYPHMDVESHLSMVEGSTMVVGEGVSVYPVDESGVTDSSLHVPFRLVTESTPAPKALNNRALHRHHPCREQSPTAVEHSTSINIYPRIPSPIGQSRARSTVVNPTTTSMQSQHGNIIRRQEPPRDEDNSMSIIGLVSKSLESVRASLRWGAARVETGPSVEKPTTAARHIATTSVPASAVEYHRDMSEVNHRPLYARSFLHDTSTASTSMNRSSNTTTANNTSQIQYRSGSSRLINSGASSNVDPTALAYLSPHTHGLAKAKAQQFKQAREARNWKSPRRSQLRERASGVNTTTHNNSSSNSTTLSHLPLR